MLSQMRTRFSLVLFAWLFVLYFFFSTVSSSPLSKPEEANADSNDKDYSADGENPVFDMEYSGDEDELDEEERDNETISVRSRRHNGEAIHFKLFSRVGLFLEMHENGTLRGTGQNGVETAQLFEIPHITLMNPEDPDTYELVTVRNQKTKKFIAINRNKELYATDVESDEARFIRKKIHGIYRTLASFPMYKNNSTFVYLAMDRNGNCKVAEEKLKCKDEEKKKCKVVEETGKWKVERKKKWKEFAFLEFENFHRGTLQRGGS